jgi:selenocysteine lyase/cysteine desulfurase
VPRISIILFHVRCIPGIKKKQRTGTSQVIIINPEPQEAQQSLIYLNNAATTWPKPTDVIMEVAHCLRQPLHEPGRTTGNRSMDYPSATREALATFFHTGPPEHFIFTQNATDSQNLLVHGFVKKTGMPFHAITTELERKSAMKHSLSS